MSACRDHDGSSAMRCEERNAGSNTFTMLSDGDVLARLEPTLTPSTQPPLIRAAVAVGTGAEMQPSASRRPSNSTGFTRPGNAQLARRATANGPEVNMYGAAVFRSVV